MENRANYFFQPQWSSPPQERIQRLDGLRSRESWAEAEADTCEAIDLMGFYARQALRDDAPQPLTPSPLPFEVNELKYIPLGVGIVIPPWNFPLAIMAGMATAALVAGNTVIMKPSHDSPTSRQFLKSDGRDLAPARRLKLCPGSASGWRAHGRTSEDPLYRFHRIQGGRIPYQRVSRQTGHGQIWIKRVVVEMGGKDTIIVDKRNLEDASAGLLRHSGFGPKMSACSRAVIVSTVYDEVFAKVTEA